MQVNSKKSFHVETAKMTVTHWQIIYLLDNENFVYLWIVKPKKNKSIWKVNTCKTITHTCVTVKD